MGKNSLSGGQVNSILPLWVVHFTLFLISVFTWVFAKSGMYQSKPIPPCLWMYSSMIKSSSLGISTVGFMAGSDATCLLLGLLLELLPGCCPWPFAVLLS